MSRKPGEDGLPDLSIPQLSSDEVPDGMDRRAFLMRSAVIGAATVITGCNLPGPKKGDLPQAAAPAAPASKLSAELNVSKKSKGPIMTVIDEFYKVGPGPSSSHTIGPMRITYDFYQRCTKLPAETTGEGHRHEGAPLRQPERHGQGTRHRAGGARRRDRQGAGDDRSAVPRRAGREAGPDLPGEAGRASRSTCRSRTSSTTRPRATSRTPTP